MSMNNEEIRFEVNVQNNISFGVDENGFNVSFSVDDIQYVPGPQGPPGPYFIPSVSPEGMISWTNTGGLPNPESRNIRGPQGEKGEDGQVYVHIVDNTQGGQTVTITA